MIQVNPAQQKEKQSKLDTFLKYANMAQGVAQTAGAVNGLMQPKPVTPGVKK